MSQTVGIPQVSRIDVIASGLDSPRKLSFSPDGALYVAEAGRELANVYNPLLDSCH